MRKLAFVIVFFALGQSALANLSGHYFSPDILIQRNGGTFKCRIDLRYLDGVNATYAYRLAYTCSSFSSSTFTWWYYPDSNNNLYFDKDLTQKVGYRTSDEIVVKYESDGKESVLELRKIPNGVNFLLKSRNLFGKEFKIFGDLQESHEMAW